MPTTTDQAVTTANVHAAAYDVSQWPDWDLLGPLAKRARLAFAHPVETRSTANTTCKGLDQKLAAAVSPSAADIGPADVIRVGTSTRSPAYGSEDLNNPVADANVDSVETHADYAVIHGFLATNQANDVGDLTECGIVTTDDTLLNHAQFGSPISKDDSRAVTVSIRLGFGPHPDE